MASARSQTVWKGDRLYLGARLSGYAVVPDKRYPTMWRVRLPDGSLSDMVNRTRAKDAAMSMLDRDLRAAESAGGGRQSDFPALGAVG